MQRQSIRRTRLRGAALVAIAATPSFTAHAADDPERSVRTIVPHATGSGSEAAARAIGQRPTEMPGRPFALFALFAKLAYDGRQIDLSFDNRTPTAAMIRSETDTWSQVVKQADIRLA